MSLAVDQYVESWRAPDASLQIQCPSCQHWTPRVPSPCVTPNRTTAQAEWLDCACMAGNGQAEHDIARGCQCVARYRLRPSGTTGRYQVAAIDYETMAARIRARQDSVSESENEIANSDQVHSWPYPFDSTGIPPFDGLEGNDNMGNEAQSPIQESEQHYGIIKVSLSLIAHLLRLPDECVPVTLNLDFDQRILNIMVEHPNIPSVTKGCPLPEVIPTYESRTDDDGTKWARCQGIEFRVREDSVTKLSREEFKRMFTESQREQYLKGRIGGGPHI